MVVLPSEFVATKYPGYFWNVNDQKLYSVKVTGELRLMKFMPPCRWNHFVLGYRVSVRGDRRTLTMDYLEKLTSTPQVFPVAQSV